MGSSEWSADDIAIVVANYPKYGPSWDGWAVYLPDRTAEAIATRARKLGLRWKGRRRYRIRDGVSAIGRVESSVMCLMAKGHAPSEIDRRLKLTPGRSAAIVSEIWRADKERS